MSSTVVRLLLILAAVAAIWGGRALQVSAPLPSDPPETNRPLSVRSVTIDLNRATRSQLIALPGIGEHLADAILEYRTAHGGFHSIMELEQVPGIGPKRREGLAHYVTPLPAGQAGAGASPP